MIDDALMLTVAGTVAQGFELLGIGAIVLGTALAVVHFVLGAAGWRRVGEVAGKRDLVPAFRKTLGRSILTGLELLVAADIIRTIAVEPTLESVLVLGAIVLIRTFLSLSLEVEIDGRWPWQKRAGAEG